MAFEYHHGFHVTFETLPELEPLILKTRDRGRFQRFVNASRRRQFKLVRDWEVTLGDTGLDLDGRIVVPIAHEGETTILDGASIPLPWVVSYLTFGLLRPLGILLTASIVHDFAYRHGVLLRRGADGVPVARAVARHDADELFRGIIASVNQSSVTSRVAWHAVRLGWPLVRYAGRRGTGRAPVMSWLTLLVVLVVLVPAVRALGLAALISLIGVGYALLIVAQRMHPQATPRVDPE